MSLAFVIYGWEPTLLLEHAVHDVTDCKVASVSDRVTGMHETVELVKRTLSKLVEAMKR